MTPKLYKLDLSPPARATMMACEIFKVPVEFIDVDLINDGHLEPEFLKKNPVHTVPVFEDEDLILHDSHAIIMYLADTYANNDDLYPKDVKERALVNQILYFDTGVLFSTVRDISFPAFKEGINKATQNKLDRIEDAYGLIEKFLTRTKYIATDRLTIADISVIASFTTMNEIVPLNSVKIKTVVSSRDHGTCNSVEIGRSFWRPINTTVFIPYPKAAAWSKEMKSYDFYQKHNARGVADFGTALRPLLNM